MPRMSGGEALARTLLGCGVDHVFGMTVGGQVSFTVSAIRAGMRMMTLRDEKCAALAATAFSRTSGRPGVCISSNPGAAHMALGMHEAHLSDVPMLAISMDVGTASLWLGAAYYDQQAMFQAVTKVTLRAESVAALPDMVRRALHAATTGRTGPAAIIVPAPLWAGEADFPEGAFDGDAEEAVHFPAMRTPPVAEAIGRAADLLVGAERPAILAGGGVKLSEASDELVEVAEHLGIPVAVTHAAHGAFPSAHPLSVGLLGSANAGNRGRIANEIVGEADVVLLVGTRMDTRTTMGDTVPSAGAKLIQVDIHAGEIGSAMPATVGIVADAKLALRGLKDALAERVAPVPVVAEAPEARRISEMMEAWRSEFNPQMTSDSTPIRTPRLFRELQGVIDDNTIVVLDAGGCSYWAPAYLDLNPENQAIYPRGAAALGSGFPMAIGAQAAAPGKRVICVSGDGAFGYNIMELESAVRLGLPVVNVVINNQNLGMERRGYLEYAGEVFPEGATFSPQDFSRIAQAYNCFGVRVEEPGELGDALRAALASGQPAVVDVVIDPEDSDWGERRPWRSY